MSLKKSILSFKDKIRFVIAKSKYDYTPSASDDAFNFNHMKHVVIMKNDAKLGDTEVMSHFYKSLREARNETTGDPLTLSVICSKNLEEIYRDILKFDNIILTSRKPNESEIKEVCNKLLSQCENNNCIDLVISTETFFRKRDFLFCKYLKPKFIAGCDKRVSCISHLIYDIHSTNRIYQSFIDLMDKGHLKYEPVKYVKFFSNTNVNKVRGSLTMQLEAKKSHLEKSRIIALNPISTSRSRSLSPFTTAKIIEDVVNFKFFDDTKSSYVLLLTPPDDHVFVEEVLKSTDDTNILFLPKGASTLDYAATFDIVDALVTVDTAAVHLADACSLKQLAFYNGVDKYTDQRWQPIGEHAISFNKEGTQNFELNIEDIESVLNAFLKDVN